MSPQPKALAVIPAHQEEQKVGQVVRAALAQGVDVLVVDDCSADRTRAEAERAGATVVSHAANLGYGGALQTGYIYARDHGYDLVVQLDADGQHDPAFIPDLLGPVREGQAEVVIGSRFLDGGIYAMPWARRLGQRIFGRLAGWLTGLKITDPTSGYQALAKAVVELYCTSFFPADYPDADMFILLHRMGFRVREIPVRMYPDEGRSMHGGFWRPLFYIYKMSLAMAMALIRKLPERGEA